MTVAEIDAETLADRLAEDPASVTVVDIRPSTAFARGHIPGSVNVPFRELTARIGKLAGADRIVTVCPHGISSRQAAMLIGSYAGTEGIPVESLRGGLEAWDGPIESGHDTRSQDSDQGPGPNSGPSADPDAPF